MATHELKTLPQMFEALEYGNLSFEVRPDDRPFEVGDTLVLRKWSPDYGYYDTDEAWRTYNPRLHAFPIERRISYILRGEEAVRFGVQPGFAVLGLDPAHELALCETEMLVLRPDYPYIFRVMPGCAKCAEIAACYESGY